MTTSTPAAQQGGFFARAMLRLAQRFSRSSFRIRWRVARGLGRIFLGGDPVFSELMHTNLRLCLPDWSATQRLELAQASATEQFFSVFERFRLWTMDEATLRQQVVLENAHLLHQFMGKQPLVLLCPHMVGMEAGSQRLLLEGSMMSIYRPSPQSDFNALRQQARSRFNSWYLVPQGAPLLPLVRRLRSGVPLFILPDVDLGSAGSVFSPFFNVPAATGLAAAWCAVRANAVVLPFSVKRVDPDRYVASVRAPLELSADNLEAATDQINAALEALIREQPEQYAWGQPRFATRPEGQKAFYTQRVLSAKRR
jgi:Kdo2-lipid IVA lauroyltransferase/acyltransferase